jgi:transposase
MIDKHRIPHKILENPIPRRRNLCSWISIVSKRYEKVIAWFTSRPQAERDQVEVVVVDMSKTYASAIKALCGEQVHVIDRFHVVQLAVDALDGVLRSVNGCGRDSDVRHHCGYW